MHWCCRLPSLCCPTCRCISGKTDSMPRKAKPLTVPQSRYGCLIVAASGAFSCIPPLLGWLSSNLHSTAGAGLAIALNISFGAPGQIVGVWIYKANEATRGYPTGHWTNAALLLFVCVSCVVLHIYYVVLNTKQRRSGQTKAYVY